MTIEYEFDEAAYLEDNPDVKKATKWAKFKSGQAHFQSFGRKEGRTPKPETIQFQFNVDVALLSKSGFFVVQGWIDDYRKKVTHMTFQIGFLKIKVETNQLQRYFRQDVSNSLDDQNMRLQHGFLLFLSLPSEVPSVDTIEVSASNSYTNNTIEVVLKNTSTTQLLDSTFQLMQHSSLSCSPLVVAENFSNLFADHLDLTWKYITEKNQQTKLTTIGSDYPSSPEFSVITVLFRNHNLFSAQSVLLFKELQQNGAEIIVCNNSPDIATSLERQARVLNKAYNINFRIINLSTNVGFSKANNVGVDAARSSKLVFINPDVLPISKEGVDHLISTAKSVEENKLLGGILYYGDGSVMHAGMTILEDDNAGDPFLSKSEHLQTILRVDHFLKGAPTSMLENIDGLTSVEAVTGALIIIHKDYFESLGGFSEEFLMGHYEDADLCMRVWEDGGEVQVNPELKLYHFEGKGSGHIQSHMQFAQHINRLKFTKKWSESHKALTAKAINIQKMVTQNFGETTNE